MRNKKGISLITLAVTILVMAILTAVVVMTTNNSGIIKNSKNTVATTNLKQVQELAQVAWTNAQIEGKETTEELDAAIKNSLTTSGVDVNKYNIVVTENGVNVTNKSENVEIVPDNTEYITSIKTKEDWNAFAAQVNSGITYLGKTVELANDISGEAILSLGTEDAPFEGTFNGNNYKMSGYQISAGQFGYLGTNGKILNLYISDINVTANTYSGGLVSYNYGLIENCHIENISVTGGRYAGGIAGYNSGKIINCSVSNSAVNAMEEVGAISGVKTATAIEQDCSSSNNSVEAI